jgi:hypothetical protein
VNVHAEDGAQDGIVHQLKPVIFAGPARLEEELAVISCFFQLFNPRPQRLQLKRHKFAELLLCLAE